MLRRDDPTPAPWTKEGKKRIERLGLTIQYPEGWQENTTNCNGNESDGDSATSPKSKGKGGKRKRKRVASDDENNSEEVAADEDEKPSKKKKKKCTFDVDADVAKLIKSDSKNQKLWDEALLFTSEGSQKFLEKVSELFLCICCQEIVYQPVSTDCSHNLCKECLKRSFKADVFNCPTCRLDLGKDFKMATNEKLQSALSRLFPGYESGR
jgi:E3 ubiquitin-protein ligase UHRF1